MNSSYPYKVTVRYLSGIPFKISDNHPVRFIQEPPGGVGKATVVFSNQELIYILDLLASAPPLLWHQQDLFYNWPL